MSIQDITRYEIPVSEQETLVQQYARAYIEEVKDKNEKEYTVLPENQRKSLRKTIDYSRNRYIVFDTETDVETQELRLGYAIVYNPLRRIKHMVNGKQFITASPETVYAFYNKAHLSEQELDLFLSYQFSDELKKHLPTLPIVYMPVEQFIHEVIYKLAFNRGYYDTQETITLVGHNIPYDLSRLAASWSEAGGDMIGGFTMRLCSCELGLDKNGKPYTSCLKHPNIRIKKIAAHKHFIKYEQKKVARGKQVTRFDGRFINTDMLAKAVLGATTPLSLKYLTTKVFDVPLPKRDTEDIDYAADLTEQFLEYSLQDVTATHYLYERLLELYKQHNVSADVSKIFSEASLGKAYLRDIGVRPFLQSNPDFPKEVLGYGMQAYYGGRSEVNVRLQPVEVIYTDFKSQYPSGNALMGIQELLLADSVEVVDTTEQVQAWLSKIDIDDLQDKATWKKLRVLVKVLPDSDMLPVRADFNGQRNIAINPVTSTVPVWYTLADVVASKLLTGKTANILQALELVPSSEQYATKPKAMFGDKRYTLDLSKVDLFTEVINVRTNVKKELSKVKKALKVAPPDKRDALLQERNYLDSIQLALKLLANSTSYGVLVEVVKNTMSKPHNVRVYADETFDSTSKAVEQPGTFFCGPLGAFIPASGRLLLAIAQRLGMDRGLTHAICDTDSFAFTALNTIPYSELLERVEDILTWFKALYPYEGTGELLELEDINKDFRDTEKYYPLLALAVSTKRYVLYNKLENGEIVIRKFTSHGTGTWSQPSSYVSPADIPLPHTYEDVKDSLELTEQEKRGISYSALGGRQYLYDLWYCAIKSVELGADFSMQSFTPEMSTVRTILENIPAFHQFTISSTTLLNHFHTDEKLTSRPFNFITVYPKLDALTANNIVLDMMVTGDEQEYQHLDNSGFYTPYTRDVAMQLTELRRLDGKGTVTILPPSLAYTLETYFSNHENKFDNFDAKGVLQRRKMIVVRLCFTGKEANSYDRMLVEELDESIPNKKLEAMQEEEIYKEVQAVNIFEHVDIKVITPFYKGDTSLLYKAQKENATLTHDTVTKLIEAVELAFSEQLNPIKEQKQATKQCRKCHEEKTVINYRKDGHSKDGYRATCKTCS